MFLSGEVRGVWPSLAITSTQINYVTFCASGGFYATHEVASVKLIGFQITLMVSSGEFVFRVCQGKSCQD